MTSVDVPKPFDFSQLSEIYHHYDTGIYVLANLRRSRAYVGATKRGFRERWDSHRFALDGRCHTVLPLQRDWLRDGSESFAFLIAQELDDSQEMAPYEQFWIDALREARVDCYNTAKATEGQRRVGVVSPIPISEDYEVYLVHEIAKRLRVSTRTVLRWIDSKQLPSMHIQGEHRVRSDALRAFLEQQPEKPVRPPMSPRHRLSLYDVIVYERDTHRIDQIAGRNLPLREGDSTALQRLQIVLPRITPRYAASIVDAGRYAPGDIFKEDA